MKSPIFHTVAVLAAVLVHTAAASGEEPQKSVSAESALYDIHSGKPLVVHVTVPLCSNTQIDCGSAVAGDPDRLETNLYWGAAFGHRRFFDRKKSGFSRVELSAGKGAVLERAIYRRNISALPFGGGADETVELLVVLEAYHGESIDKAVLDFYERATHGGTVRFQDGDKQREERISIAGYAGHNRLMDGLTFPKAAAGERRGHAIPSFALACYSESYMGPSLREAGSKTLLMTRALMAPEGYVLDAVVSAVGENAAPAGIRERAVGAYAKWQKLSNGAAGSIFQK